MSKARRVFALFQEPWIFCISLRELLDCSMQYGSKCVHTRYHLQHGNLANRFYRNAELLKPKAKKRYYRVHNYQESGHVPERDLPVLLEPWQVWGCDHFFGEPVWAVGGEILLPQKPQWANPHRSDLAVTHEPRKCTLKQWPNPLLV